MRLLVNIQRELSHFIGKFRAPPGIRELPPAVPQDFSAFSRRLWRNVRPYTMTSQERIHCIEQAIRYLVHYRIDDDIVECGVAAGGSMMAAALTLLELGDTSRTIFLYDTFAGMTEPGDQDVSNFGKSAKRRYFERLKDG